ncbi:unnamed protein product [Miscanthus lutarioriparius]|uniref:Uncharacterized protein n=1 Tax=Miscanthus lutarioriparius TaxID=422564 RepID=A0A811NX89_9POAL|nr:unnamed protein product [Miscanthus lutarioriparius]
MSNQKADQSVLDDITNNNTVLVQPPVDEAERKREERNRKQQEYRARIKANETDEQREERNKRRREQRVLKRTESSTHNIGPDHGQQAPYGVCSGILQASDAEDKGNVCPENNTDWLHKNYNYVRTRQLTSHTSCVPNSLTSHNLFNATTTPEDHLEAPRALDIDDLLDDEETRQYIGEDGAFESYRVSVDGVDLNNNEDPYDYVYQNLSDRHHVLRKVPNCLYYGAMKFQYLL